jgi:hypothetical protein
MAGATGEPPNWCDAHRPEYVAGRIGCICGRCGTCSHSILAAWLAACAAWCGGSPLIPRRAAAGAAAAQAALLVGMRSYTQPSWQEGPKAARHANSPAVHFPRRHFRRFRFAVEARLTELRRANAVLPRTCA